MSPQPSPPSKPVPPRSAISSTPSTSPASSSPVSLNDPRESPFGASLEPILHQACDGRLSRITWFRTDWQRGGALTGYATFRDADETAQPVVIKLPVPPVELQWLVQLQPYSDVTPRLHAYGDMLGGYDMAWVVMERLPFGPLSQAWDGCEFDLLVEAVGRFYHAASAFPVQGNGTHKDWDAIFKSARDNIHAHEVAHEQRWTQALKKAHRKLKEWLKIWEDRPLTDWCHGDLHLGNAMTRIAPPQGPAVLLDFAQTHPGHWTEDAVYCESLFWCRRQRLGGRKLCSQIAHERKRLGLHVDSDWPHLASIRRGLMALSTPAALQHVGDPPHVEAALEVLEREVGT